MEIGREGGGNFGYVTENGVNSNGSDDVSVFCGVKYLRDVREWSYNHGEIFVEMRRELL